ncbi:MAG: ROK family transcriptional regulator [Saprospiraceae bacterium]
MEKIEIQGDKFDCLGNLNKIKVLQIIRNEKEITRSEILQKTRLSAPTVTRIVESLVQLNLIQTVGIGSSVGGRPPQIIRFNARENYVIGIDIGATFIRAALSNLAGEFIFEIHVHTNFKEGFDEVMQQVGDLIEKLNDKALNKELRLWGIGIAVSGMINKNSGIVEYSPIFNWKNVNIQEALSKYTTLNIALGNVVNLIAIGEMLYGIGKQYKSFICLNVGYGIGAGIISDGKLFTGADGIAGEIGHIVLDRNSKRKGMEGVAGTLEALASGYGIADIAQKEAPIDVHSILNKMDSHKIDAKSVFHASRKGDTLANEIVNSVAEYLSLGIDILIKLFNTECIVISGGVIRNNEILLEKIRNELKTYSMSAVSRSVSIVSSSFGENAALMGSFSLILEKILQLEIQLPDMNNQKGRIHSATE